MKSAMKNLPKNMGTMDRIVRSAIGGAMLTSGLDHANNTLWNRFSTLIGGAFVFYGITGYDPLLSVLGVTTHPNDKNSLMNLIRSGSRAEPKPQEQQFQKPVEMMNKAVGVG